MKKVANKVTTKVNTKPAKVQYDVFSKSRGYLCSCINEDEVHRSLKALFHENERFWRNARAMGKRWKRFDCYGVATQGNSARIIELMFDAPAEEDTYEDVVEETK